MGDAQSAQRPDGTYAAAGERGESEQVQDAEAQLHDKPAKVQISDIDGTEDASLVNTNGHCEDEKTEDGEETFETNDIIDKEAPNEASDNGEQSVTLEVTSMEAKQNDINDGLKRFFSNIGFRLTVKSGSADLPTIETDVESAPDDTNPPRTETKEQTVELVELKQEQKSSDNDSTGCSTLTDVTSADFRENTDDKTSEQVDVVVETLETATSSFVGEESQTQQDTKLDDEQRPTSPSSLDQEVLESPMKKFFTTGIFSGLRKKKKPEDVDTAEKEVADEEENETNVIADEDQPKESGRGEDATVEDKNTIFPEEKVILSNAAENMESEIVSSHEKVQASPLKRFFASPSLRKFAKKQQDNISIESTLCKFGEHVLDEQCLFKSEEHQKDEDQVSKVEENSAWASFKKLMTPKKTIKKPNEEPQAEVNEQRLSDGEKLSDSSTEQIKKRKDSSVSWETVLCGSGRRKSQKESQEEVQETDDSKPVREAKTVDSQEEDSDDAMATSLKQAERSSDSEAGFTWNSFKRLITPKRKAREDEEAGLKVKQDELSMQAEGDIKSAEVAEAESEDESETPAVIPLSEFDDDVIQADVTTHVPEDENLTEITDTATPDDGEPKVDDRTVASEMKTSSKKEEVDEFADVISKHPQLSDITEESVLTEMVVAPVNEEPARDDTLGEDLTDITSEAMTAPEPVDVTLTDETEMVSAVSQFSESTKTSGGTTPVQVYYSLEETEKMLTQVVETISTAAEVIPLSSEEPRVKSIAGSVSNQLLGAVFKDEPTLLEIHRKSDASDIQTGLSVEEIDDERNIKATVEMESLSGFDKVLSTEMASEMAAEDVDQAELVMDEVAVSRSEEVQIQQVESKTKEDDTGPTSKESEVEGAIKETDEVEDHLAAMVDELQLENTVVQTKEMFAPVAEASTITEDVGHKEELLPSVASGDGPQTDSLKEAKQETPAEESSNLESVEECNVQIKVTSEHLPEVLQTNGESGKETELSEDIATRKRLQKSALTDHDQEPEQVYSEESGDPLGSSKVPQEEIPEEDQTRANEILVEENSGVPEELTELQSEDFETTPEVKIDFSDVDQETREHKQEAELLVETQESVSEVELLIEKDHHDAEPDQNQDNLENTPEDMVDRVEGCAEVRDITNDAPASTQTLPPEELEVTHTGQAVDLVHPVGSEEVCTDEATHVPSEEPEVVIDLTDEKLLKEEIDEKEDVEVTQEVLTVESVEERTVESEDKTKESQILELTKETFMDAEQSHVEGVPQDIEETEVITEEATEEAAVEQREPQEDSESVECHIDDTQTTDQPNEEKVVIIEENRETVDMGMNQDLGPGSESTLDPKQCFTVAGDSPEQTIDADELVDQVLDTPKIEEIPPIKSEQMQDLELEEGTSPDSVDKAQYILENTHSSDVVDSNTELVEKHDDMTREDVLSSSVIDPPAEELEATQTDQVVEPLDALCSEEVCTEEATHVLPEEAEVVMDLSDEKLLKEEIDEKEDVHLEVTRDVLTVESVEERTVESEDKTEQDLLILEFTKETIMDAEQSHVEGLEGAPQDIEEMEVITEEATEEVVVEQREPQEESGECQIDDTQKPDQPNEEVVIIEEKEAVDMGMNQDVGPETESEQCFAQVIETVAGDSPEQTIDADELVDQAVDTPKSKDSPDSVDKHQDLLINTQEHGSDVVDSNTELAEKHDDMTREDVLSSTVVDPPAEELEATQTDQVVEPLDALCSEEVCAEEATKEAEVVMDLSDEKLLKEEIDEKEDVHLEVTRDVLTVESVEERTVESEPTEETIMAAEQSHVEGAPEDTVETEVITEEATVVEQHEPKEESVECQIDDTQKTDQTNEEEVVIIEESEEKEAVDMGLNQGLGPETESEQCFAQIIETVAGDSPEQAINAYELVDQIVDTPKSKDSPDSMDKHQALQEHGSDVVDSNTELAEKHDDMTREDVLSSSVIDPPAEELEATQTDQVVEPLDALCSEEVFTEEATHVLPEEAEVVMDLSDEKLLKEEIDEKEDVHLEVTRDVLTVESVEERTVESEDKTEQDLLILEPTKETIMDAEQSHVEGAPQDIEETEVITEEATEEAVVEQREPQEESVQCQIDDTQKPDQPNEEEVVIIEENKEKEAVDMGMNPDVGPENESEQCFAQIIETAAGDSPEQTIDADELVDQVVDTPKSEDSPDSVDKHQDLQEHVSDVVDSNTELAEKHDDMTREDVLSSSVIDPPAEELEATQTDQVVEPLDALCSEEVCAEEATHVLPEEAGVVMDLSDEKLLKEEIDEKEDVHLEVTRDVLTVESVEERTVASEDKTEQDSLILELTKETIMDAEQSHVEGLEGAPQDTVETEVITEEATVLEQCEPQEESVQCQIDDTQKNDQPTEEVVIIEENKEKEAVDMGMNQDVGPETESEQCFAQVIETVVHYAPEQTINVDELKVVDTPKREDTSQGSVDQHQHLLINTQEHGSDVVDSNTEPAEKHDDMTREDVISSTVVDPPAEELKVTQTGQGVEPLDALCSEEVCAEEATKEAEVVRDLSDEKLLKEEIDEKEDVHLEVTRDVLTVESVEERTVESEDKVPGDTEETDVITEEATEEAVAEQCEPKEESVQCQIDDTQKTERPNEEDVVIIEENKEHEAVDMGLNQDLGPENESSLDPEQCFAQIIETVVHYAPEQTVNADDFVDQVVITPRSEDTSPDSMNEKNVDLQMTQDVLTVEEQTVESGESFDCNTLQQEESIEAESELVDSAGLSSQAVVTKVVREGIITEAEGETRRSPEITGEKSFKHPAEEITSSDCSQELVPGDTSLTATESSTVEPQNETLTQVQSNAELTTAQDQARDMSVTVQEASLDEEEQSLQILERVVDDAAEQEIAADKVDDGTVQSRADDSEEMKDADDESGQNKERRAQITGCGVEGPNTDGPEESSAHIEQEDKAATEQDSLPSVNEVIKDAKDESVSDIPEVTEAIELLVSSNMPLVEKELELEEATVKDQDDKDTEKDSPPLEATVDTEQCNVESVEKVETETVSLIKVEDQDDKETTVEQESPQMEPAKETCADAKQCEVEILAEETETVALTQIDDRENNETDTDKTEQASRTPEPTKEQSHVGKVECSPEDTEETDDVTQEAKEETVAEQREDSESVVENVDAQKPDPPSQESVIVTDDNKVEEAAMNQDVGPENESEQCFAQIIEAVVHYAPERTADELENHDTSAELKQDLELVEVTPQCPVQEGSSTDGFKGDQVPAAEGDNDRELNRENDETLLVERSSDLEHLNEERVPATPENKEMLAASGDQCSELAEESILHSKEHRVEKEIEAMDDKKQDTGSKLDEASSILKAAEGSDCSVEVVEDVTVESKSEAVTTEPAVINVDLKECSVQRGEGDESQVEPKEEETAKYNSEDDAESQAMKTDVDSGLVVSEPRQDSSSKAEQKERMKEVSEEIRGSLEDKDLPSLEPSVTEQPEVPETQLDLAVPTQSEVVPVEDIEGKHHPARVPDFEVSLGQTIRAGIVEAVELKCEETKNILLTDAHLSAEESSCAPNETQTVRAEVFEESEAEMLCAVQHEDLGEVARAEMVTQEVEHEEEAAEVSRKDVSLTLTGVKETTATLSTPLKDVMEREENQVKMVDFRASEVRIMESKHVEAQAEKHTEAQTVLEGDAGKQVEVGKVVEDDLETDALLHSSGHDEACETFEAHQGNEEAPLLENMVIKVLMDEPQEETNVSEVEEAEELRNDGAAQDEVVQNLEEAAARSVESRNDFTMATGDQCAAEHVWKSKVCGSVQMSVKDDEDVWQDAEESVLTEEDEGTTHYEECVDAHAEEQESAEVFEIAPENEREQESCDTLESDADEFAAALEDPDVPTTTIATAD